MTDTTPMTMEQLERRRWKGTQEIAAQIAAADARAVLREKELAAIPRPPALPPKDEREYVLLGFPLWLTQREALILLRRAEGLTLAQVGAEVGIKAERVRQCENKAQRKARFYLSRVDPERAASIGSDRKSYKEFTRTLGLALAPLI